LPPQAGGSLNCRAIHGCQNRRLPRLIRSGFGWSELFRPHFPLRQSARARIYIRALRPTLNLVHKPQTVQRAVNSYCGRGRNTGGPNWAASPHRLPDGAPHSCVGDHSSALLLAHPAERIEIATGDFADEESPPGVRPPSDSVACSRASRNCAGRPRSQHGSLCGATIPPDVN